MDITQGKQSPFKNPELSFNLCSLSEHSESAVNTITDTMIISRAPLLEINETSFDESPSSPKTEMTEISSTLHDSTPESMTNAQEIPAVKLAPVSKNNNEDNQEV
jgi:hypothetical protein